MRATIVDFKAEKHEISWEVVCESMGISQYIQWNTALTDTPEMRPSTIMRTLRSIRNAISIDFHAIRPPEMQTPRYSVKWTLGSTVSLPIQIHPHHSGHFGNKIVDSLVKQITGTKG